MANEKKTSPKLDPFVAVLREERLARKIGQGEMANTLDFNAATLGNYENGVSSPRMDLMRDWCSLLNYELVMNKVEKPGRSRRKTAPSQAADDIPEDLATVYLSRYQAALAMGMLMAQAAAVREKSPAMSDDLQMIADILARSIH